MTCFLALLGEADAAFAPLLPHVSGKPHPFWRCGEIASKLHAHLVKRLERLSYAVERTIREFVGTGGAFRSD
jgi:hypothetical protein